MKLKSNRKFIVAMSIIALTAIGIIFKRLESGDAANVFVAIGVAFMGGNAMEHWSKKGGADAGD